MVLLLDLTFPLNNAVPQQSKDEAFVFQGSLNAGDYLELEPYAQRMPMWSRGRPCETFARYSEGSSVRKGRERTN